MLICCMDAGLWNPGIAPCYLSNRFLDSNWAFALIMTVNLDVSSHVFHAAETRP